MSNEKSIQLYQGIIEDTKEDIQRWEEANEQWGKTFVQDRDGWESENIIIKGHIKNSIIGGNISNVSINGNRMDQPPYPQEKFETANRLIETMEQKIKDLKG